MRIRRSDWLTAVAALVCWELGVFLMAPVTHRSLNYYLMATGIVFAVFLALYPRLIRKKPKNKATNAAQPQG